MKPATKFIDLAKPTGEFRAYKVDSKQRTTLVDTNLFPQGVQVR